MAYGTAMNRSPSSSGLLPLPGSPGSSWAVYKARLQSVFQGADSRVLIAFWLFGLINNVSYVIILSAALDLVGPTVPKGVVLLADVLPSFLTKLVAPYFIHAVPYSIRVLVMCALSTVGMFTIALTPSVLTEGGTISTKLFGVVLASLASGVGELSMLGLTHYYGPFSLAAWGSGTGGAGLIGAGLYVLLTSTIGLSVKTSLLACATLPFIMPLAFFLVLPQSPLRLAQSNKGYTSIPRISISDDDLPSTSAALLGSNPPSGATAYTTHSRLSSPPPQPKTSRSTFHTNLRRARSLFIPYMAPLLLVYIAEYTINQGISPSLLFPLDPSSASHSVPFTTYRSFYPTYAFLYQLGVFISRSSTPFLRLRSLYTPSLLQVLNMLLLAAHSAFFFLPSVWLVFLVIFWEGLLGGAVYVNTFAAIMESKEGEEREWSLGATSVSDSGGIMIASLLGMVIEPRLCEINVRAGRPWCRDLDT